jgi:hAT family C-terminal dimerisation region
MMRLATENLKEIGTTSQAILPLQAVSAPSERIFSLAGVLINAKRSSLSPSTVDKIVFVHENSAIFCENLGIHDEFHERCSTNFRLKTLLDCY